jgi:hypothetical protein
LVKLAYRPTEKTTMSQIFKLTTCLIAAAALYLVSPTGLAEPTAIEADKLSSIVQTLASDAFEGRAPGTPGEDKTVEFLIKEMADLG